MLRGVGAILFRRDRRGKRSTRSRRRPSRVYVSRTFHWADVIRVAICGSLYTVGADPATEPRQRMSKTFLHYVLRYIALIE